MVHSSLAVDTSMLTLSEWSESSSESDKPQKERDTVITEVSSVSSSPTNSEDATNVDILE